MKKLVIKKTSELTPEQVFKIMEQRIQVFIIEQNCLFQDVDEQDNNAIHIYYEDSENGDIIAYARVVPYENDSNFMSFGRILVNQKYRHQGFGRKIVEEAIKEIKAQFPGQNIKIAAQSYLLDFYKSFGFKVTSKPFEEAFRTHNEMELDV